MTCSLNFIAASLCITIIMVTALITSVIKRVAELKSEVIVNPSDFIAERIDSVMMTDLDDEGKVKLCELVVSNAKKQEVINKITEM